jgi:hypothetical protein
MSYYMVRVLALFLLACSAGPAVVEESGGALAAPGWMGNASYVISRATCSGAPCDSDRRSLDAGFVFDDWAWSRAATTRAYFDVWQPGVTDWDNPDLWKQLDARAYYRAGGAGAFQFAWVPFDGRRGNDARYAFDVRGIDPFFDSSRGARKPIERAEDCPSTAFRVGADGRSLEIDVEIYFEVNGVQLRPSAGATYRGTYSTSMITPGVCVPAPAPVLDHRGTDVTVTQAWLATPVTGSEQGPSLGGIRFDPALCDGNDCTVPVEEALRQPGAAQTSPLIAPLLYTRFVSGACEMIELRVVVRQGALDASTFAGLGFYYSFTPAQIVSVPKSRLHAIASVTLKDGTPAVEHRLLAPGMCFGQGGNSGSIYRRRYELRPFARFATATTEHRVWDDVSQDYLLARARDGVGFVSGFDRRADVLR